MKVFYGSVIQGARDRKERADVHRHLIGVLKCLGHSVVTEHTTGESLEEARSLLEEAIGPLPQGDIEKRQYVRDKMIEAVEGD